MDIQYGFIIPGGDLATIIDLACEAEQAGWDAVFYWDGIYIQEAGPMYDPWIVLAAIAIRTTRVPIGAMLTPVSRRRPWKLARETTTLGHLSHGRLVLPVGLGALNDGGFSKVNEVRDRKTRAALLDEGLEILTGLWSGQPFSFHGAHYQVEEMTFLPPPVQSPRIPVWVVGAWPRMKSMRRVLRYDGLLPAKINADGSFADVTPADIRSMRAYVDEHRTQLTPFAIVFEGETPGDDHARAEEIIRPYAEAGITWWLESRWGAMHQPEVVRARIRQGPPRLPPVRARTIQPRVHLPSPLQRRGGPCLSASLLTSAKCICVGVPRVLNARAHSACFCGRETAGRRCASRAISLGLWGYWIRSRRCGGWILGERCWSRWRGSCGRRA